MCTVTVSPKSAGFVVTMNRDEQRSRHEAGLKTATKNGIELCYPVDSESGGTWVGSNNRGVVLALLNRYQAPTFDHAISRGGIITEALARGDTNACKAFLQGLNAKHYNAFDCLLISHTETSHFSWDRTSYRWQTINPAQPLMLTSSSERLEQVQRYRQQRFSQWRERAHSFQDIDLFHLEQSATVARSSVFMAREKTHTKSLVQIAVTQTRCELNYFDENALHPNARLADLTPSGNWQAATYPHQKTAIAS